MSLYGSILANKWRKLSPFGSPCDLVDLCPEPLELLRAVIDSIAASMAKERTGVYVLPNGSPCYL